MIDRLCTYTVSTVVIGTVGQSQSDAVEGDPEPFVAPQFTKGLVHAWSGPAVPLALRGDQLVLSALPSPDTSCPACSGRHRAGRTGPACSARAQPVGRRRGSRGSLRAPRRPSPPRRAAPPSCWLCALLRWQCRADVPRAGPDASVASQRRPCFSAEPGRDSSGLIRSWIYGSKYRE